MNRVKGIDPAPKTGELALLLIRLYRSLSLLVGHDRRQLGQWIQNANRNTIGVPAEQVQRTEKLVEIVQVLDAMRAPIQTMDLQPFAAAAEHLEPAGQNG